MTEAAKVVALAVKRWQRCPVPARWPRCTACETTYAPRLQPWGTR